MKIVYIIPGLYIGGAEVMLYNLLSNIDRDRFEPVIVCLIDRVFLEKIRGFGYSRSYCRNAVRQTNYRFCPTLNQNY